MKTILLDLDDTLIDTKLRQYTIIENFFKSIGKTIPNFDTYIAMRFNKQLSNRQFVDTFCNNENVLLEYNNYQEKFIESLHFLLLDSLIVNLNLMDELKIMGFGFVILSLRKNIKNGMLQIKRLGLSRIVDEIIFVTHNDKINPKTEKIKNIIKRYNVEYFVGDSETDYESAIKNNIKFIFVETGCYSLIKELHPYPSINEFLNNLKNHEKI